MIEIVDQSFAQLVSFQFSLYVGACLFKLFLANGQLVYLGFFDGHSFQYVTTFVATGFKEKEVTAVFKEFHQGKIVTPFGSWS